MTYGLRSALGDSRQAGWRAPILGSLGGSKDAVFQENLRESTCRGFFPLVRLVDARTAVKGQSWGRPAVREPGFQNLLDR